MEAGNTRNAVQRPLGNSGIEVTPVAMGCWPITGITSLNVTVEQSEATLQAAFDAGINFFDTAYCYGFEGESERMIGRVLGDHRDEIVIATKGGLHWEDGKTVHDGCAETLLRECEESLQRLGTDRVELYYLHAPDPDVPISESAGAIRQLIDSGKVLAAGLSNATREQLAEFHDVCPLAAYQPHYNMLQREIEESQLPWCREHNVAAAVYWPLLKGLLAGKLARDHVFATGDGRAKYPMFQGEEWQRNQDFVDRLREIADGLGRTVADVVINWTIQQPGITTALCGAKRPEQIADTAQAMSWQLSADDLAAVNQVLEERGQPVSRGAVSS